MKGIDLHIHTTFSDSSLTPEEVVKQAVSAGLEAIAITDHDSIDGIQSAIECAKGYSIEIIPGVEISTVFEEREIHILGYLVDYRNEELHDELKKLELGRIKRARQIVAKLTECGVPISFDRVVEIAGAGVVGRPHIAKAMVEKGEVSSHSEAFTRYIAEGASCYVAKKMLTHTRSIDLIRQVGGVPILAHPKDERTMMCVPELVLAGLAGIEVWHPDHRPKFVSYLISYTGKNGLIATGGSDCHGARKSKPRIGEFRLPVKIVEDLKAFQRIHACSPDPS